MPVNPIPAETSTVIPYFVVGDARKLMEFLKRAFDAKEKHLSQMPDGTVMHAHLRIGDSSVMLGQTPEGKDLPPAMLYMYVNDVDGIYQRAIQAGATSINEPSDQFYGDRVCAVKDPAGNQWWLASHTEDIGDEVLARRASAARERK